MGPANHKQSGKKGEGGRNETHEFLVTATAEGLTRESSKLQHRRQAGGATKELYLGARLDGPSSQKDSDNHG